MKSVSEVQQLVMSFADARSCVEEHAAKIAIPRSETVPLLEAANRVLAEDIFADRDFPPFPRATRDGYAVRADDLANLPARLKSVGQIKAGSSLHGEIKSCECAETMTGAPVPLGADAVVMVEYTKVAPTTANGFVEVQRSVKPGENVVPAGSEARAGERVLQRGTRMAHSQIAVAAAVGKSAVEVYKRPRVAILSTGDEVVEITSTPGPFQIRNSNSFSLAAQIAAAGAEPWQLPIAPDEPGRLRELIRLGLTADLLLLSGGVSMGKYDLVEEILGELNAEFFFTGALIQPGKPVVFGSVNDGAKQEKHFFGLPGNPISTMVTFELFARPMLDALSGAPPAPLVFANAKLKTDFKTKTGLTRFLPALRSGDHMEPTVEFAGWQGSGDIFSAAKANCYLVVPPDRETIPAGEMVTILLRDA